MTFTLNSLPGDCIRSIAEFMMFRDQIYTFSLISKSIYNDLLTYPNTMRYYKNYERFISTKNKNEYIILVEDEYYEYSYGKYINILDGEGEHINMEININAYITNIDIEHYRKLLYEYNELRIYNEISTYYNSFRYKSLSLLRNVFDKGNKPRCYNKRYELPTDSFLYPIKFTKNIKQDKISSFDIKYLDYLEELTYEKMTECFELLYKNERLDVDMKNVNKYNIITSKTYIRIEKAEKTISDILLSLNMRDTLAFIFNYVDTIYYNAKPRVYINYLLYPKYTAYTYIVNEPLSINRCIIDGSGNLWKTISFDRSFHTGIITLFNTNKKVDISKLLSDIELWFKRGYSFAVTDGELKVITKYLDNKKIYYNIKYRNLK